MKRKLKFSRTSVYNIGYHFIWCQKYRRKVLVGRFRKRLKELLYEKAKQIGVNIDEMEIMPDHVHLFVKTTPKIAPYGIVKHLKGYSSRILGLEFSQPLWTRSYYCESVGHISEQTVRKYIASQRENGCIKSQLPPS